MWELAAKVGISLFTICGFNPFEESLMVKANFTMLKNVVKVEMSIWFRLSVTSEGLKGAKLLENTGALSFKV